MSAFRDLASVWGSGALATMRAIVRSCSFCAAVNWGLDELAELAELGQLGAELDDLDLCRSTPFRTASITAGVADARRDATGTHHTGTPYPRR